MATVNKNFRIKQGLVVEGTTGTINGQNILTETGSDTYILNLIGGETLVKSVASGLSVDGAGELSINRTVVDGWYDESGAASSAETAANTYTDTALNDYTPTSSLDTTVGGYGYLKSGDLPTMYADSDVDAHLSGGDGITYSSGTISADLGTGLNIGAGKIEVDRSTVDGWYDAAGAASSAQSAAESYADGLASNYDAAGSASTAETNANTYTDTALNDYTPTASLDTTIDGYGYLKSADLSGYATETYVGTAIDNLVDGAPGLLDTLNEIAAAIADDANYATTMTTALAGKQDELTASTGITIDGSNNISVTANTYDAYGAASSAQSAAESYADGLASNYDAAGTASGLVDDLKDATTPFTEINVNDQAKQIAATSSINTGSASTVYQWAKADYRSAKLLIKIDNGTHNEVSEILVTLDSSDNVAITEYAIVGTNGSRGTISAIVSGSNVAITVNPTSNSTVKVTGTLLK